jgi:hypothetical protein
LQAIQMADNDFDNLYIVTRRLCFGRIKTSLIQSTYGAPSP